MKLCKCGCGQEVSRERNRFINHHNSRGKNNLNYKEKITKTCEFCNKQFKVVPSQENAKFCSKSCYDNYQSISNTGENNPNYGNKWSEEQKEKLSGENSPNWKGKITKICKYCKKEFKVYPSQEHIRFCSQNCAYNYISGENSPNWKEKITKICLVCDKQFQVVPSRGESAKFCSRTCYGIYKSEFLKEKNNPNYGNKWSEETRKRMSGENAPNWKGGKITKTCIVCRKKFQVKLSNEHAKFCSHSCHGIYQSGENNPMYGKPPKHHHGTYYQSPLQNKIYLRSSYELAYAKYLDKQKILWLYEEFTFDLDDTTYTPDFYLIKDDKFIEIKGYMFKKSQEKINQFLDEYTWNLDILYKNDLLKLGIELKKMKTSKK